ncbi:acyltransferase family protein [Microbacterium sp. 3J1]|uniref:acyltransferase family protein n=1 Tax=Microbacterium sp. 3J1 TaxID=861269 RepID=UPI000B2BD15A|nr:acyltransferase family protein [Microbacterium sp. 3J1]
MSTETLSRQGGFRPASAPPKAGAGGKRLDIQGLRALAVTLVVVFHLLPALLPGGYIGVDVFFVISGFLITAHLVRELEATGTVRVTEFWARRVRRLLPASLLVLAVCAVLTFTVMPGITRVQNFTEIAFASGYILNWNLAASAVDYLNASNPESLVQHYWSLSVEEQFYLVWPLLLVVAVFLALRGRPSHGDRRSARATTVTTRRAVLLVLLLVFIASLVFSIVETARSQPSAYFITTTRAWEFALGGIVALVPTVRLAKTVHVALSWAALAAIVGSAFAFGAGTAFPGAIALIPVGATALLIVLGDSDFGLSPQRLSHIGPVQWVGDLSYSIYLWHWPLIVVVAANVGEWPSWVRIPLILAATGVLALLTERYVERPFRRPKGLFRRRSVTFGAMAASIILIVGAVIPAAYALQAAVDQRQQDLQEQLEGSGTGADDCVGAQAVYNDCDDAFAYTEYVDPTFAQGDGPWAWFDAGAAADACSSETVGSWVERSCAFGAAEPASANVLLIGDSHADHIVAPLQKVSEENGWDLRVETRQACNPFRVASSADDENAARCAAWGAEAIDAAAADPDLQVVIVSTRGDSGEWPENAAGAFRELRAAGKSVIVVTDTPNVDGRDVRDGDLITGPACILAAGEVTDACAWTDSPTDTWVEDVAAGEGIPLLDLRSVVCPEGTCHAVVGGLIAFSDENHLSGSYALSLTGWFQRELAPLVRAAVGG